MNNTNKLNIILTVVVSYIAAQILSDILSLKIILIGAMSVDAGTIIYPVTFTLRDLVHKSIGKKSTQLVIVLAAIINIIMAVLFYVVSKMPAPSELVDQSSMNYAETTALFGNVLAPAFRIVLASIVAELISEFIDTEIYSLWVAKITNKCQWLRVIVSNLVSVPVDSIIFCVIAFYGILPMSIIGSIIISNIVIKMLVTVLSPWLIYIVPENVLK